MYFFNSSYELYEYITDNSYEITDYIYKRIENYINLDSSSDYITLFTYYENSEIQTVKISSKVDKLIKPLKKCLNKFEEMEEFEKCSKCLNLINTIST